MERKGREGRETKTERQRERTRKGRERREREGGGRKGRKEMKKKKEEIEIRGGLWDGKLIKKDNAPWECFYISLVMQSSAWESNSLGCFGQIWATVTRTLRLVTRSTEGARISGVSTLSR